MVPCGRVVRGTAPLVVHRSVMSRCAGTHTLRPPLPLDRLVPEELHTSRMRHPRRNEQRAPSGHHGSPGGPGFRCASGGVPGPRGGLPAGPDRCGKVRARVPPHHVRRPAHNRAHGRHRAEQPHITRTHESPGPHVGGTDPRHHPEQPHTHRTHETPDPHVGRTHPPHRAEESHTTRTPGTPEPHSGRVRAAAPARVGRTTAPPHGRAVTASTRPCAGGTGTPAPAHLGDAQAPGPRAGRGRHASAPPCPQATRLRTPPRAGNPAPVTPHRRGTHASAPLRRARRRPPVTARAVRVHVATRPRPRHRRAPGAPHAPARNPGRGGGVRVPPLTGSRSLPYAAAGPARRSGPSAPGPTGTRAPPRGPGPRRRAS